MTLPMRPNDILCGGKDGDLWHEHELGSQWQEFRTIRLVRNCTGKPLSASVTFALDSEGKRVVSIDDAWTYSHYRWAADYDVSKDRTVADGDIIFAVACSVGASTTRVNP